MINSQFFQNKCQPKCWIPFLKEVNLFLIIHIIRFAMMQVGEDFKAKWSSKFSGTCSVLCNEVNSEQ